MRELHVVNREMVIPLHSHLDLGSAHLYLLLGLWPMYFLILELYLRSLDSLLYCVTSIVVCLSFFPVFFWTTVRGNIYTPKPCLLYYSVWHFLWLGLLIKLGVTFFMSKNMNNCKSFNKQFHQEFDNECF